MRTRIAVAILFAALRLHAGAPTSGEYMMLAADVPAIEAVGTDDEPPLLARRRGGARIRSC